MKREKTEQEVQGMLNVSESTDALQDAQPQPLQPAIKEEDVTQIMQSQIEQGLVQSPQSQSQSQPQPIKSSSFLTELIGRVPAKSWTRVVTDTQLMVAAAPQECFYSWEVFTKNGPRLISGPSAGLVRTVAAERGGLYVELVEESVQGSQLHFTLRAVDLATGNIRVRPYTFTIPPAPARYAQDEVNRQRWWQMEYNNAISRAERNILTALIPSFVLETLKDKAMTLCQKALDEQTPERLIDYLNQKAAQVGYTLEYFERLLMIKRRDWTHRDAVVILAYLNDIERELRERGEFSSKEEEKNETIS